MRSVVKDEGWEGMLGSMAAGSDPGCPRLSARLEGVSELRSGFMVCGRSLLRTMSRSLPGGTAANGGWALALEASHEPAKFLNVEAGDVL